MAILRNRGGLAIECDECGELSDGHPDDYQSVWAMLKEEGWRAFKNDDGRWQNCCPDCKSNWGREQHAAENNDVREELARKRDDWMERRARGDFGPPRDPPQRSQPARSNPPPRRRSNDRPPWE